MTMVDNGRSNEESARLYYSDLNNSKRFISRFKSQIRYPIDQQTWYAYDGKRWRPNAELEIQELAKRAAEDFYCPENLSHGDWRYWKDIYASAQGRSRINSMIGLSRSDESVRCNADEFDSRPLLLNLKNCVFDIDAKEPYRHAPDFFCSSISDIEHDPQAECPMFLESLNRWCGGDPEMIEFLQKLLGYCLTGLVDEQMLPMLYGDGSNGKSTLVNLFLHIFGDYGQSAPSSLLVDRTNTQVPADLARLKGKRFVDIPELDVGQILSESTVKRLTGGDLITARHYYGQWFQFYSQAKLLLSSNNLPVIASHDHGIWRRPVVVPFDQRIGLAERDGQLPVKLRSEASGVLNWGIEGFQKWKNDGLLKSLPTRVRRATRMYRASADPVWSFVDNTCHSSTDAKMLFTELYEHYVAEQKGANRAALEFKTFNKRVRSFGIEEKKIACGKIWLGITRPRPRVELRTEDRVVHPN